jgi:SAM-dependent methyltransferase
MTMTDAASTLERPAELTPVALLPMMHELFVRQLAMREDEYLRCHCNNLGVIRAHLRTVLRYLPFVQGPKVLDWGCYHAFDSCVIRHALGPDVEMQGCDIFDAPAPVFHEFAGLRYRKLEHLYHLPYANGEFDTVIGSGVLEHVVNPSESLKELHRVLKDGGQLIITFAPNQWSLTELVLALMGGAGHPRRYTRTGLRRLLIDHGFLVEALNYHEVAPTLTSPSVAWLRELPGMRRAMDWLERLNPVLDRLWPVNVFGQNLFVIGRRVNFVHGTHPKRNRTGLWRKERAACGS